MSLLVVQKVAVFDFTRKAFEEVRVCGDFKKVQFSRSVVSDSL